LLFLFIKACSDPKLPTNYISSSSAINAEMFLDSISSLMVLLPEGIAPEVTVPVGKGLNMLPKVGVRK